MLLRYRDHTDNYAYVEQPACCSEWFTVSLAKEGRGASPFQSSPTGGRLLGVFFVKINYA